MYKNPALYINLKRSRKNTLTLRHKKADRQKHNRSVRVCVQNDVQMKKYRENNTERKWDRWEENEKKIVKKKEREGKIERQNRAG